MSTKFQTSSNYDYTQTPGETASSLLPSLTQPDQSMTVQEILRKYVGGKPLPASNDLSYHDLPDLRQLDLVELEELKENTATRIAELQAQKKIEDAESAKMADDEAKRKEEAFIAKIRDLDKSEPK